MKLRETTWNYAKLRETSGNMRIGKEPASSRYLAQDGTASDKADSEHVTQGYFRSQGKEYRSIT